MHTKQLQTAYRSPTLEGLDGKDQPNPWPACGSCPASIWSISVNGLQCFCALKKEQCWGGEIPPILVCDGREFAVAKFLIGQHGQVA